MLKYEMKDNRQGNTDTLCIHVTAEEAQELERLPFNTTPHEILMEGARAIKHRCQQIRDNRMRQIVEDNGEKVNVASE